MNSVQEIGNLTQDPELRYTQDGTAVTNFSIAVNEKFNGKEKVHFFPVVCWRKLAEAVAEYQRKGSKVAVQGRLEQQRWEDADGNKKSMIKIVAGNVDFLSPRKNGEKTITETSAEETPVDEPPMDVEEPPLGDGEDGPF